MKHTSAVAIVACSCLLIVAFFCTSAQGASLLVKRAVAKGSRPNGGESTPVKICHVSTPCGWAVYVPFTRRVDYFLSNTCECPKTKKCLRTDDDLSVSAYVYRCRVDTAGTSTEHSS